MPPELLPSLLISLVAVGYTPGPANIYALSCVLAHGRRNAFKAWTGLVLGFSIGAIGTAVAAYFTGLLLGDYLKYIRIAGAAYILYLAYKTLRSGLSESGGDMPCSFWNGVLVQVTNPKIILFDLTAYSSYVLPYSQNFVDLLPVALLLFIAGPGANLVWFLAGAALRPFVIKYQKTVNILLAAALLACAAMILFL